MATVTFDVAPPIITKLTGGNIAIGKFLLAVFDLSGVNKQQICEHLLAFHNDAGGSAEVEGFDILPDEVVFNADTYTGKFTIKYRVRFFYGCADIVKDQPATEKVDFAINRANDKLTVTVQDPIYRNTVDEF